MKRDTISGNLKIGKKFGIVWGLNSRSFGRSILHTPYLAKKKFGFKFFSEISVSFHHLVTISYNCLILVFKSKFFYEMQFNICQIKYLKTH